MGEVTSRKFMCQPQEQTGRPGGVSWGEGRPPGGHGPSRRRDEAEPREDTHWTGPKRSVRRPRVRGVRRPLAYHFTTPLI
jgi:hypothetical protein